MARTISLVTAIGAALALAAPAAGGRPYADGVERAVEQRAIGGQAQPDFWNYRAGANVANTSPGLTPRGLARLYAPAGERQLGVAGPPDAFERALANGGRNEHVIVANTRFIAADNRYVLERSRAQAPVAAPVASSGREVRWPQVGIGFGVGLCAAFALLAGLLLVRTRRRSPVPQ